MTETLTAVQDRDMHRAINKLIRDEGLTGENALAAYVEWELRGYEYVMAARNYCARKAERDYNKAYKLRKKAEASQ